MFLLSWHQEVSKSLKQLQADTASGSGRMSTEMLKSRRELLFRTLPSSLRKEGQVLQEQKSNHALYENP